MPNLSIEDIKLIIETHFGKPNIYKWKNSEFLKLSREIKRETTVLISASTLKRIFGKRKTTSEYTPQRATINALTSYALSIDKRENKKLGNEKKSIRLTLRYSLLTIVFGLLAFLIFNLINIKNEEIKTARINFKSVEGINAATVFFDLNLPESKNEDYSIYFGDYSDTVPLDNKQNKIGHFYKYPGVFYPEILHKKQKISNDISVLVASDEWVGLGTYQHLNIENNVFPIPKDLLYKPEGFLHMTTKNLAKIGIDTTKVSLLRLYNYQNFEIDGDNFEMSFRLKRINFWPGIFCNNVVLKMQTEHGIIQQYFPKLGCSFWMDSIYSDVNKKGNSENLSPFCIDLSDWKTLKIANLDKKISFYKNDSLIDTIKYKNPLGHILGIEIHFFGTGFFDDFNLSSSDNLKTFNYNFDN